MSCSDCSSGAGGCDSRKGTQRTLLDEILARIYPDRTWGRPDDEARFRAGVPRAEVRRIARSLAATCKAPAFFRPGEDEDLCDFVWILCVGRPPALVDLRDGLLQRSEAPEAPEPGVPLVETYLRIAFSSVARIAAMQQVSLALYAPEEGDGDGDGGLVLGETARPGVFDAVLLKRVRTTVALLEASDIAHIDFGLLDVPLDGADPGDYEARYGTYPRLANFLFQAAPPTIERHALVAAPAFVEAALA